MVVEVSTVTDNDESAHRAGPIEELAELGFTKETLAALAPAIAATRLVVYEAGDTIYHEATAIDSLYVIQSGRIKLLHHLENGRTRIVRLHNRGSVIGINGLMDDLHSHTAIAIDNVLIYQIPMCLIKLVKEESPDTYGQLLEYWHEYLNIADTWIIDFSTGAIRGRVARLLRHLVETDEGTGPSEVIALTVEEMADVLGVTPESVSRIMADLKRKKILQAIDNSQDHYRCNMEYLLREAEQ
jgi:CRP/FNR family transcriptional regulator